MFIDFRVSQVLPAQNDADNDDAGGPCPTGTSTQTYTGTKYPVQGIPPHSDVTESWDKECIAHGMCLHQKAGLTKTSVLYLWVAF